MKLQFHPTAAEEFGAAVEYYEAAVPGLGNRFLLAVREATNLAVERQRQGESAARPDASECMASPTISPVAFGPRCLPLPIITGVPATGGPAGSAPRRTA